MNTMMARLKLIPAAFTVIVLMSCGHQATDNIPPNTAGKLAVKDSILSLEYDGNKILILAVNAPASDFTVNELSDTCNEKVSHLFTITSKTGKQLNINGLITAGKESFACEAYRRIEGAQIVRHTYGPDLSKLNRAVYDREKDWLLSADQSYTSASLSIAPGISDSVSNRFSIVTQCNQVTFRFRPHYYQKHRGLSYFEPWKYKVWNKSVAGWCSWFAFKTGITQENIRCSAEVIAETMKPYGLEYFQIDDGYQQEGGQPETWIHSNEKFPDGLENLAAYIKSLGLKPGIWTNVANHDSAFVVSHKQWFVTDPDGSPASGRWIDYILDGSGRNALDSMITPVYSHFSETGWQYFKLDALRHLLYEGYNSNSEYFGKKGADREEAFRNVVEQVRKDIGKDNFMLACWGVLPAVVGLADGCRIGNDGFGYAALAQYNSFNNVIWRNDPDHIELTPEEAWRSCMTTSLTGSLFMVTDKPEVYNTSLISPARKSLPVLFTMPGQVFDLDPSRSMMLDRTMTEMSGSGEREADGSRTTPFDLFMLDLNMPWERWVMLGRTGTREKMVTVDDLGLEPGKEYLVYEFWSEDYIGVISDKLIFDEIDPAFNCQLFCIRAKTDHPQVLATDRHISCGATDLIDVSWQENTLGGKSHIVAGDEYTIVIYEPEGYESSGLHASGATVIRNTVSKNIHRITLLNQTGEDISWSLTY
jgi:alpha-galactosidase